MNNSYIIPSLQRGVRIIEAILSNENGLTPLELEEKFSVPKTTIFRILYTLQHENWVEKHGERYKAGHRLVQASMETLSGMELRSLSVPFLEKLSQELGETSHLGVWAGKQIMLAEVCDGPKHIRVASRAGSITPVYCSSIGKVLLAAGIGSANVKDFFGGVQLEKHTPTTISDYDDLAAELERINIQGYAVDDREYRDNVRCLAAPVRNSFGSVVAAIGITATTLTFTEEMIPEVASKVKAVAWELSQALGAH